MFYDAIVIDTETTDKDEPEVIETAFVSVGIGNGGVNQLSVVHQEYFKNTKPISFGAMAVHHILPHQVVNLKPYDSDTFYRASYIIGHNIDFDWKVLGEWKCKRICTLAMARAVWPDFDSHSLGALMYALSSDLVVTRSLLRNAHSAAADVSFCVAILSKILAANPQIKTMEQLWEFSEECRIPKVMSFSKHKGKPIGEVDNGWRNWYARQSDTDPYLLEAFRRTPYGSKA